MCKVGQQCPMGSRLASIGRPSIRASSSRKGPCCGWSPYILLNVLANTCLTLDYIDPHPTVLVTVSAYTILPSLVQNMELAIGERAWSLVTDLFLEQ